MFSTKKRFLILLIMTSVFIVCGVVAQMNLFSLVVMVFCCCVSLLLIRHLAPYERTSKLKYITLKSNFLCKCLIPKVSGYVKVADRKKISLFSFVFSLLFALLVIALVSVFILPDIPCEPFIGRFGKRGRIKWTINTLNEKLIYLLPILFFLIEIIAFSSLGILEAIKSKTESKKSLYGLFGALIMFVGLFVFMAFQLF